MFSQSCNCLPNKKQSFFGNQLPQNMGLLRSLTTKSYEESAAHISLDFQGRPTMSGNDNSYSSRTNLMDLVYSFADTSRIKFNRRYMSTFSIPTERSKLNCKEIITHCNTMTASPFARSYVVGGFVGSKSQIGRRRKNDVGKINLWDMIRDLIDLAVGNAPNFPEKNNHRSSSSMDKQCEFMEKSNILQESLNHNKPVGLNGLEEPLRSQKQSYADVAKRVSKDHQCVEVTMQSEAHRSVKSSEGYIKPVPVIEPALCNRTNLSNRDRISSDCSADSEDSFIVFECCEDDNEDKDIESSEDESISHFEEVSQSDSGIVPSRNSSFCTTSASKKVRFAEGKSLVQVHPMVTWDFAYRMARRGPWEVCARDSERFRLRIAKTEAVLKPILDPQHRSVVFRDRFADSVHCSQ